MVIQGGKYDGQTLGELYKEDPVAAQDIYLNYRDEQKDAISQKKDKAEKIKQETDAELDSFSSGIAKDLFEKEDVSSLTPDEGKKVDEVVNSVLDWMDQTGRFHYKLEDAFMIMNKDDLIAGAKSDGAKALIKNLKEGSTPSIKANKGTGGKKIGYEAYGEMTQEEMASKIDAMGDVEYESFRKNAPKSLKDKYPGVDWD